MDINEKSDVMVIPLEMKNVSRVNIEIFNYNGFKQNAFPLDYEIGALLCMLIIISKNLEYLSCERMTTPIQWSL